MSGTDTVYSSADQTESAQIVTLTKRQERAMLAFLWSAGPLGFDGEACDGAVWDVGVRPWPTMDNLAAKGLVENTGWWGPEEGHLWRLTDAGAAYMTQVVASRGGPRGRTL